MLNRERRTQTAETVTLAAIRRSRSVSVRIGRGRPEWENSTGLTQCQFFTLGQISDSGHFNPWQ